MQDTFICPHCGKPGQRYRNPFPTVDIIIRIADQIVLIERRNPPLGWALPGGFVDLQADCREASAEKK